MYKFFDYLLPDLPVKAIGELAGYIRRFAAMQRSDIPVEGHMGAWRSAPPSSPPATCGYTGCRWRGSASRWTPRCERE